MAEYLTNGITEELSPAVFEGIGKLDRDLKASAALLGKRQIRFLVDSYYVVQKFRIAADAQVRASKEGDEPNKLLQWGADQYRVFEKNYQRAMDVWTNEYTVGRWLKSICGIGPVISAGILAHLDITKAPNTGHFWSFAGLNDKCIWPSKEEATKIVRAEIESVRTNGYNAFIAVNDYYKYSGQENHPVSEQDISMAKLLLERHPTTAQTIIPTMGRMHKVAKTAGDFAVKVAQFDTALSFFQQLCQERELPTNFEDCGPIEMPIVRAVAERCGRHVLNLFQQARKTNGEITVASLATALCKRPWNTKLKTLVVFKLGESFVKVQANTKDYYGHLFRDRRDFLESENNQLKYKEFAEAVLNKKNYGDDTQAKAAYLQGKLPPAHLHARARRWTIKMFLSHLHEVMFNNYYGKAPPVPWVLENIPGHTHRLEVPNWPFTDTGKNLKDMKE